MLKTEDEARQRWCPMLKSRSGEADEKGHFAIDKNDLCIASECMAWRWAYGRPEPDNPAKVGPRRSSGAQGNPLGYCGLAGNPESDR